MRFVAIPLLAAAVLASVLGDDSNYVRDVEQYRTQREASLKRDDGWLSVVGLFRLKQGVNRVGAVEIDDIALPASAPARLGKIALLGDRVLYNGTQLRPAIDILRTGTSSF